MKGGEVFRFEVGLHARRPSTWVYFAVLLGLSFHVVREMFVAEARAAGHVFNTPANLAELTLVVSTMALLVFAGIAGDAGARDVQTRMHPLFYTAPVSRAAYLGGRFAAALLLNALLLLAIPLGLVLAASLPGPEPELVAPFRAGTYLAPYLYLALPNAVVATAILFAMAALGRRAVTSYLGAILLFFAALLNLLLVAEKMQRWDVARLLDPLGFVAVGERLRTWTPAQKAALPIELEDPLLWNRLLWMGIALTVLALLHARFRFAHPAAGGRARRADRGEGHPAASAALARSAPIAVPRTRRTFGPRTRARQTAAVAWDSFRTVVTSWGGAALAFLTLLLVLVGPEWSEHLGVPLYPTTGTFTRFIGHSGELLWMIVPLLTVYYAGELVWRERDAGLSEIADAAPVRDGTALLGRFLGLALVLVTLQALMMAASMTMQAILGYFRFEIALYGRILLGLQLADLLLFAALAMAVHVIVNHKYVAHVVLVATYVFMAFAPSLGIAHNLLVYGGDPGWSYSDMRGFGGAIGAWTWFTLYWAAWALLLGVAARLLWVRGTECGPRRRLELARRRFAGPAAGAAAAALVLIVGLGGFVFYNTNVLNDAPTDAERVAAAVAYERRYGRYADAQQPWLTATELRVEIHPRERRAEVRGTHHLVNRGGVPIDSIHLATRPAVETGAVRFDRPATRVLADDALGHRIYVLATPLQPGDSLRLHFAVRYAPRGFRNDGVDAAVAANGTFFRRHDWLPELGYRRSRELTGAGERRAHGLPPRSAYRALEDTAARRDLRGTERIAFRAVVGTDGDQLPVAPGRLLRRWTDGGRRYAEYVADAPIANDYAIFSAAYAVREGAWTPPDGGRPVQIQVLHHPTHGANAPRMIRSVQASLDVLTRQFGPYPHGRFRLVEHPGASVSLHAYPVNVSYHEGFSLFRPERDPRRIDLPFAVVAHEVAHTWWGHALMPADVEGAPLLTESLAWYSAFQVVERTYGPEHLGRLLDMMREVYLDPRARAGVPLLRLNDRTVAYRKGAFALYAVRAYVGEAPVNDALRRLLGAHRSGAPPLATSLDLYRELRTATPDSLHPLLHDLFAANTFWELETRAVRAEPAAPGTWRVTMDVHARKGVVDTAAVETEVPMNDPIEVGVYAAGEDDARGPALYRGMHRIRSGAQRITVTVRGEPARAGIDPRHLLMDVKPADNVAEVRRGGGG